MENKNLRNSNRGQVDAAIASLRKKIGDSLDEEAARRDIEEMLEKGISLSSLDEKKYKRDTENSSLSGGDLSFSLGYKNGRFIAKSPDGSVIEAESFEDLDKRIAKSFKSKAEEEGKEPQAYFHVGKEKKGGLVQRLLGKKGKGELTPEQKMEVFAKVFINEGLVVSGDVPKNAEFWENLKKEYLANSDNSEENWDRLTRRVPPEYMGKAVSKWNTTEGRRLSNLRGTRETTPKKGEGGRQHSNTNTGANPNSNTNRTSRGGNGL